MTIDGDKTTVNGTSLTMRNWAIIARPHSIRHSRFQLWRWEFAAVQREELPLP